jgi:hypothetical protein
MTVEQLEAMSDEELGRFHGDAVKWYREAHRASLDVKAALRSGQTSAAHLFAFKVDTGAIGVLQMDVDGRAYTSWPGNEPHTQALLDATPPEMQMAAKALWMTFTDKVRAFEDIQKALTIQAGRVFGIPTSWGAVQQ